MTTSVVVETICPQRGVQLPSEAHNVSHRHHSDASFARARDTAWEDGFQALPSDDEDGTWYVMEAECETVCAGLSEAHAQVIAAALNCYWQHEGI
jgi:hypothetical protein